MWVNLKRDGPFGPKKVPGRVRIALTYKSYVDEEEEDSDEKEASLSPYIKVYGDAGAESVEDIGVSLGEAIDASLMEEAKRKSEGGEIETAETEIETEIVSTQRDDASVEVTTSPKSFENEKLHANGNARVNGAASRRRMDDSKQGNGSAAIKREQTDLHQTNASETDTSEDNFVFPRGFGDKGDIRVPRREDNGVAGKHMQGEGPSLSEDSRAGVWDRELESLATTRSSEARESLGSRAFQGWKRSSQSTYSEASEGNPEVNGTAFPTHQKDEGFRFEKEAEVGAEETSSDVSPKTEGNKLLWLCMFTTVAYIIGCSLHLSNPLHP